MRHPIKPWNGFRAAVSHLPRYFYASALLAMMLTSSARSEEKVPPQRNSNGAFLEIVPSTDISMAIFEKDFRGKELHVYGAPKPGLIRVIAIGCVAKQGIYHIDESSSLMNAINLAGGFSPLASSRLLIKRGSFVIFLNIGASHGVAPITKDILPLFNLKDGDAIYVNEVSPF
jgi:hypothetical protein